MKQLSIILQEDNRYIVIKIRCAVLLIYIYIKTHSLDGFHYIRITFQFYMLSTLL